MAKYTQFVPVDLNDLDLSFYRSASVTLLNDLLVKSRLVDGQVDIANFSRGDYSLDLYGSGFPPSAQFEPTGRVEAVTEYVWGRNGATTVFELTSIDVETADVVRVIETRGVKDDRALVADLLSGDDVIKLSRGDDVMSGFRGDDRMSGGRGNDTLFGDGGADNVSGGAGMDRLFGGGGADRLSGGGQLDKLLGGGGRDTLKGGNGNDDLRGQGGSDTLIGGRGADRMVGGAGADTFVFTRSGTARSNEDKVIDFRVGVDTLEFRTGDTMRSLTFVTEDGKDSVTVEHEGGSVELLGISVDDLTRDSFAF